LAKLTTNKVNMATSTNEYIFYDKKIYAKINFSSNKQEWNNYGKIKHG